jgi:hypothetical protein
VADVDGDKEESQAFVMTETEKERNNEDREEAQPLVLPFIPDMTGSDKEIAQESSDSVNDIAQDNSEQTGQVSDTTGSTPDILKSPDRINTTNVETQAAIVIEKSPEKIEKSPEKIGQMDVQNPFS